VVVGLLAALTMPVAIVATRWSTAYELVHSAIAIPFAVALGLFALKLAAWGRVVSDLDLTQSRGARSARVARLLGMVGLCLAASATVSIAVFGILTYLGNRS
jgi:L-lactate permease